MHNTHRMTINKQWYGAALVALSGMLYGLIGYCGTKLFQAHFSISAMLFWRFFIALIWSAAGSFFLKKNLAITVSTRKIIKILLLGGLTYSTGTAFYFASTHYIGTGIAMVIFFSFPVFVTLFAWLSGWKMNKYAFASLLAVMLGLVLLKGQGNQSLNWLGVLMALGSAFFYALYIYSSQYSAKFVDSRLLTLLICLGNSLVFFIVACYTKTFLLPTTLHAWIYILTIGIVATALPIQLLLDGLKYISPVKASILSVLEPVVTMIVGMCLLHETISVEQTIGIMVVLLGAMVIQFEKAAHQ
jgi:drug/metabolite transporter (DMT)-like permease